MESNFQTNSNTPQNFTPPAMSQPIASQPINQSQPSKKPNRVVVILSILSAIFLIAAGVFAYLYFASSNSNQDQTQQAQETSSEEDPAVAEDEEVELTDTYILRDLDEKIAILHYHYTTETGSLLKNSYLAYNYSTSLYTEGTLSEIAKVAHLANSIKPDLYLSYDEKQSAIREQGYNDENARYFETNVNEGIKAETLAAKYLDLFGQTLNHGATNGQFFCPDIYYNQEYDFYYSPGLGCGGTGPYVGYYFKNKYTVDNEHAYVYISTATYNGEDNKIYCDVIPSESNLPAVCGEVTEANGFTIDESNYQDFAQYRFVFNKVDDGTYYFSKVEKL